MAACEECWDNAYVAARTRGGFQADHYRDELAKHPEHAETQDQRQEKP